jgi:UDP-N-acetylmuramoyl-tripeptide--D-alanyl-D-alanine ligase
MLELGAYAETGHRGVGSFAAEAGFDMVVGLGEGGRTIMEGAVAAGMPSERALWFGSKDDLVAFLTGELRGGDVVLLKASRGVGLEDILETVGVRGG